MRAGQKVDIFIKQWQEGDELAFNAIMDHYFPRLIVSCLQMVRSREDAEELVMNTMLKLWQHRKGLSDVLKSDDYIFGILRQEIVRRSRKRIVAQVSIENIALNDLGAVQPPGFTLQDIQARYHTALSKLTPKQREIFLSSREQDMTQREIADRMGLSVHTVNNHMTTALKILRKEMKDCSETLAFILLVSPYMASLFI